VKFGHVVFDVVERQTDRHNKNSSGDEIANVNLFTTISHTYFKITKKTEPNSFRCLHGLLPAPVLLSYSVFDFDFFSLFFVSGPCARLSWPSRQLLSARNSTVSYRIVLYRISKLNDG